MNPEQLIPYLESLIFASNQPVKIVEFQEVLKAHFEKEITEEAISEALNLLREKYSPPSFGFELAEIGEGYQFLTKSSYHELIASLLNQRTKKRLGTAALETLAIIAYKQPISKSDVEAIRGVNCDYSINKLLEKELIKITGRADTPGKALLYGTGEAFMDYFGIRSVDELPRLKDLKPREDNEIGEQED